MEATLTCVGYVVVHIMMSFPDLGRRQCLLQWKLCALQAADLFSLLPFPPFLLPFPGEF